MKLRLGKMPLAELAQWFGRTYSTLSKKAGKEKYFKILESYCVFEPYKGGVDIIKIYNDTYIPVREKVRETIFELYDKVWKDDGLDSNQDVIRRIVEIHPEFLKANRPDGYEISTLEAIGIEARNYYYGKPFKIDDGVIGYCEYQQCTRDKETYELRELTPEEEKAKKQIYKLYFANLDDKFVMVKSMVKDGELKEEQAWNYLETVVLRGSNGWAGFYSSMKNLGIPITKGTKVTRDAFKCAGAETLDIECGELE